MLAALPEEARGILKKGCWRKIASPKAQAMYQRTVENKDVVLAISGVGKIRAQAVARAVLREQSPDAVISIGFAGGLAPGQQAGDLIVAQTLMTAETPPGDGETIRADRALTCKALRLLGASALRHRAGTCVTAPQIIYSPDAKRRLGLASKALAVDMESFWIGLACRERKTAFLAARAIVDTAERPMPDFAAQFASNATRWKAILSATLHPRSLPELVRLAAAASRARNSLSDFAEAFMEEWPMTELPSSAKTTRMSISAKAQ